MKILTFEGADTRYSTITADFILTGDLKTYRSELSTAYGPELSKQMYAKIDSILGSEAYKLTWRTVAYTMRHGNKFKVTAARFGTDYRMVDEIVMQASDGAIERVREIALSNAVLDVFTKVEDAYFMKELTAFAKREVHTKLKFLVSYDQATDVDDYVQLLLIKGLLSVWRYSYFTKTDGSRDLLKILNFGKASIHNSALSIIRTATSDSKARIKNHMKACGECPACKRNDTMQCYTSSPAYEATCVPIDTPTGNALESNINHDRSEARMVLYKVINDRPDVMKALTSLCNSNSLDDILDQCQDTKGYARIREAMKLLEVSH